VLGHKNIGAGRVVDQEIVGFVMNGEVLESTFAEAVLMSSIVHEILRLDSSICTFDIHDKEIDSNSSGLFLDFVRPRHCVCFLARRRRRGASETEITNKFE
jgi:hypothetical protein